MSQQTVIDCQRFATEQQTLSGEFAVISLERLHDQLFDTEGNVSFELSGWRGDRGQVSFRLKVDGVLHLVCQRCLGGLPFELSVDSRFEMLPAGIEVSQEELEDDSKDFLPLEKMLNVFDLVEDEVILALPVAAKHSECDLQGRAEAGGNVSPFAALASIKTGLN